MNVLVGQSGGEALYLELKLKYLDLEFTKQL